MSEEVVKQNDSTKKPIYKQWWFWVIIGVFVIAGYGASLNKTDEKSGDETNQGSSQTTTGKKYELSSNSLGEYGKAVVLNKDSDMPATKNLYKLPAGKYKVTTTNKKYSAFWIVKDEIGKEDSKYPEILQYVGEQYTLTAGDDDLNGHASKEATITLKEDESIFLPDSNNYITLEELKEE